MAARFPFGVFPGFGNGFPGDFDMFSGGQRPGNDRFYRLLGVSRSISCEDVPSAFEEKAKSTPPNSAEFAELVQAAEVLSDPAKRRMYDIGGEELVNQMQSQYSDFGRNPLFRKPGESIKSQDTVIPLDVSLEEVFYGAEKTVEVLRVRPCPTCKGVDKSRYNVCRQCRGTGKTEFDSSFIYSKCVPCNGSGKLPDSSPRCLSCTGRKTTEERKMFKLTIEKGVPDGHNYAFQDQGDQYPDQLCGNLVVQIHYLRHSLFQFRSADLILHKKLTFGEALTGYKFAFRHLDGTDHCIASPPGETTPPDTKKMVKNLGLPIFGKPTKFGDLIVEFEVEFPEDGSISSYAAQILREKLPYPSPSPDPETFQPGERHHLIPFNEGHISKSAVPAYSDHQSQDEEEEQRARQRFSNVRTVHCSATLF